MESLLYIHVPFCQRLCGYCDFYKTISLKQLPLYPDALLAEARARAGELAGTTLRTIYLGGGTPSLFTPEEVGKILCGVADVWDTSQVAEITLEANPDDLSAERLEGYRKVGVNRLSIGIQSFDDEQLRFMNRRHDAATARRAVEAARRAGFDNISIDLIYGVPCGGSEVWQRNIEEAIALNPEHISAYHLTIEEGTVFGKRGVQPIEEERSEEEYLLLHRLLTEAGYDHYEISNFARQGCRSQHNSGYWRGVPYVGLGPGAHSFDGAGRSWNLPNLTRYIANPTDPDLRESEVLTAEEQAEELIMVGLRTREGIDLQTIEQRFGAERASYTARVAEQFVASGVLIREGSRLRFDAEHWLVSDAVISELF